MRRRTFVLGALGAAAAVAFGWRRLPRRGSAARTPEEIEADLREYYAYLEFDDALLGAFMRDLARLPQPLHRGELRRRFLLSTDFFVSGEDESRPLAYRAFCDPYLSPCYQPFA
ncbi:MAG: hypothetical protein WEF50_20575 [Myxococcota bacterium]